VTDVSWLGFLVTLALVLLITAAVGASRLAPRLKVFICAALGLRVVGSQAYLLVFGDSYYGGGDYLMYYRQGLEYAQRMSQGDFAMLVRSAEWWGATWWGTQFVFFPTGAVLSLLGPTLQGGFVAFALLGFLGLIGFAVAFRRMYPHVPVERYLLLLWLLPSLWFWPAAIGKDALLLMGLGLAVWGYVGREGRVQWLLLSVGVFFIFGVRPQVAGVVVLCLILGHLVARVDRWSAAKVAQAVGVLAVGFWMMVVSSQAVGIDGLDVAGLGDYVDGRVDAATTAGRGNTAVAVAARGPGGAALGAFNVLFRPFPWEASNLGTFIASIEIWGMWLLSWFYRRNIVAAVRGWRSDRLRAASALFIIIYTTLLGLTVVNLGIIARQRIFVFPFLFLLFAAAPRVQERLRRASRTRMVRRHPVPAGRGIG
jgi:hypothetical protein